MRYVICDPSMLCDTAWALILVTPVNDPPQPEKDILSVEEDTVNAEIIPLANDSDPDGDVLFIGNVTLASGGTINVVDSTFIYYSPPADYFGADTILYESCDSFTCVLDTICITVTPVNDAPNAIDDTDVIAEDSISKIAFLENDSDIEDDELTYQIITDPVAGTYSIVNDTLTYVPNENYNGADSLEYVICDQEPLCDTAWITITISEVNDPPSGYNPPGNPPGDLSICVNEDTTNVEILPISGGSEVDGDQLFIATYTLPISGGTAILQGDTMIIYTPPADYFGQDTIFIDVCDNLGLCVMDTIPITVKPVVDPVIAVDDMVSVLENDSTIIDAISNDQNPDGGMLSITIISNPTNGIASIDANQIKYVPTSDYHGQDSLVYEVCNTFGQCDMAVVYITVEFVNESPIAFDDNVTITDTSCVTIPVLINDSDPDNDTLIVSIIPTGNNSISVDENGAIEYCPPANYFLTDTIYYMVCDTHAVPLCDTAIVVITMSCNSFSHILTHNAFCPNEPFNIAGAEIRDLTSYEWSYPDVLGIISTDPELIDFMISEPSDFILKSTRFGCEPQFDTIHVEVRQEVSTPDVVDEILECEDASVTLSVTSPDPTLNYQWYKVPGTVPIASGADIVIPILNARTEGEYYVIANDGSCDSEPSINLNLQIQTDLTPPAIEAGDDQNSCENKSVLGATPSMNNQAMWYTNGTSFIVDPNDPNSRVFDLVIGENKFYWEQTNSSCIDNSLDSVIITYAPEPDVVQDSFFITTNELVSLDLLENDALYGLAYSINFQSLPLFIADHGDGSISLEVTKDMPNPIFFNYEVCFDACPQNCSNAQVSIHYESIDIGKVPNVFTPNGDGINDLFVINNINQYPENKLVIFNRWGDQVYAKKGYDNSWDGNFKDAPLAVGTYFYIFELGDENQTIETGFIHLDR